jgi:thiol-disulfide isomerase/thioredoxin
MHHQAGVVSRLALVAVLAGTAPAAGHGPLVPFSEKVHREVLAAGRGQVVLFNFWATWCAPCREEMPLLVDLERRYRDKGFRLVTVSADDPEDRESALRFLEQHRVAGPAYLKSVSDDDAFISAIDSAWSGALPALFLYDRRGKLAVKFIGETKIGALEQAVKRLL